MRHIGLHTGPLLLWAAWAGCSSPAPQRPGIEAGGAAGQGPIGTGGGVVAGAGGSAGGSIVIVPGDAGNSTGGNVIITSMRIEPADAVIDVAPGAVGMGTCRVLAGINGGPEQDITFRSVFDVPDNWQVGTFPDASKPLFSTSSVEPRGGKVTVRAAAANSDGSITRVTTSLLVRFSGTMPDARIRYGGAGPALPPDPARLFGGSADSSRAPQIVYPSDGVMMPPNIGRIDVHFMPGAANTLFEVGFKGPAVDIKYYVRCGNPIEGGCVVPLDIDGSRYIGQGNRGLSPVAVTVRGTDDTGAGVGTSTAVNMAFSETELQGAIYYWAIVAAIGSGRYTSSIMRFDFAQPNSTPEQFIALGQGSACVGCHALSRNGLKLASLFGGQWGGGLVYAPDLTKLPTDPALLALNNDATQGLQFSSFSPTGDRFVGVYGGAQGASADSAKFLYFHDGTTGRRVAAETLALPLEPDHPEWSPDGNTIAFTIVGKHYNSQKPGGAGIGLVRKNGAAWNAMPEVLLPPNQPGVVHYAPSFAPDSSFFLFNEAHCATDQAGGESSGEACNADDDPSAKVWAMAPTQGAKPVLLANASRPGLADGANTSFADTYPRVSPFSSKNGAGKLFWVTVGSHRRAGLLNGPFISWPPINTRKLVWMFAVDPAKVLASADGSYPGFYLPIQYSPTDAAMPHPSAAEDQRSSGLVKTSNHLAQWTARIASAPPPPDPVPPPPPPAPPPIVK
jgi:hypothetical protein